MVQTLDLVHNSLQAKLPRGRKSDARMHRTPKHFVRNAKKCDPISRKLATGPVRPTGGLSECERVPRRFCFSRRCLSARCQRRAQMPNFVFYIARIFDGLRDFLADEPAITPPQIVKLFFNRGLCYRQGSSQILIRNICAIRGKIKAQRLKQSEPTSALAFLAQTPERLFDYCRSPTQIEQLLRRPRIERLRRDR